MKLKIVIQKIKNPSEFFTFSANTYNISDFFEKFFDYFENFEDVSVRFLKDEVIEIEKGE